VFDKEYRNVKCVISWILFYLSIYLFITRHEVYSTDTHTLQNAGR